MVRCKTESGKVLTVYSFPCHPTMMSVANLQVSADSTGDEHNNRVFDKYYGYWK